MTRDNIGKFYISSVLVENDIESLSEVFSRLRFIPVRCEHLFYERKFEMVGVSPLFDENPPHCVVPEYVVEIIRDKDGVIEKVEVVRQS